MKTIEQIALSVLAMGLALGGSSSALAQSEAAPSAAAAQPSAAPADVFDQTRETQIMAQVIQDSLEALWEKDKAKEEAKAPAAAGKDDSKKAAADSDKKQSEALNSELDALSLQSQSLIREANALTVATPFRYVRGGVSGSYVPTVGAIFSFSVDFPLSPPPAAPAAIAAPAERPANDLWDQHSAPDASIIGIDPRTNSKVERLSNGTIRVVPVTGNEYIQAAPGGPAYDPAKVAALRKTILDAIGKYGHRMEHLGDDERIIVVISTGLSVRSVLSVSSSAAPGANTSSSGSTPGAKVASSTNYTYARTLKSLGAFGGAGDNLLLSIRKGDLKKEVSGETLGQGRVTERSYLSDSGRGYAVAPRSYSVPAFATSATGGGSGSSGVSTFSTLP